MNSKNLKRIIIALIILILLVPACAFGYMYYKLGSIYDEGGDESILGTNDYKSEKGIVNILLCGTDARPGETNSRTDSMMILTIDNNNKNLKLTSLARDTYVSTSEYGDIKLTEANAYGGINLLIETIEQNFELDIQDYVIVDFYSFMDIVDTLGGISVDIKDYEISELNKFIPETYRFNTNKNKGDIEYIEEPGVQKINGYQALAYCRIRKGTSGGALERDKRQRETIQSILDGISQLSVIEYPKLVNTILPYVKTNMKPNRIIEIGSHVLKMGDLNIHQMEFPIEDEVNGRYAMVNNKSVMLFEKSSLKILHDFIFNNVMYEKNS